MADFKEKVSMSCRLLSSAQSDEDKVAALWMATPSIQSDQNDSRTLSQLFCSLEPSFLQKMLSGNLDVPLDDDDIDCYRMTALNVLVSFCVIPDIAKRKSILGMIPQVFELLRGSKEVEDILECAMQFFKCIIQHDEGRQALIANKAIKELAWLYSKYKSDDALDLIDILLRDDVTNDKSSFNSLMTSLAEDFSKNQTNQKFSICHRLLRILSSGKYSDKAAIANQKWPKLVLKGLKDILTSRIDDKQRVPALKLASVMVDSYGMEWAVSETERPTITTPQQRQFQLLLVHLSSIECRMQMEDQPISSILKNADLIIACFAILEKAVQDLLAEQIEMREKDQIVQSYSDAAAAVMTTIASLSTFEETIEQQKMFLYAMIEFLLSGFAYDVLTSDAEAYKYSPFIMKMTEKSFRDYEKWFLATNGVDSKRDAPVDLFEFLVPALQHFATREGGQKIIIDHFDVILAHMDFSWSVVQSGIVDSQLSKCARSSYSLLVKMTEMLTDAILFKPENIKGVENFSVLFEKIAAMLPILEQNSVFDSLLATTSILGLLLIKHEVTIFQEQDPRVVIVLNGSLQFLKAYKPKTLNTDGSVFQVGDNTRFWVNTREMCLLGDHLLGNLVRAVPWIESHIESSSPELLEDVKKQNIEETSIVK